MERHHAEVAERADRMHELLRMLREAEGKRDLEGPRERAKRAARAR